MEKRRAQLIRLASMPRHIQMAVVIALFGSFFLGMFSLFYYMGVLFL